MDRGWIASVVRSATFATWVSQSVKLANQALVLPIALSVLSVEEASLWLLFYSFTAIGVLADFGFSQTFIRFVSYADAAPVQDARRASGFQDFRLDDITGAMRRVYALLAVICVALLGTLGTVAVARPISLIPNAAEGWISWVVVIGGTIAMLYNVMYGAFLQGRNQIALFRRWEAVAGLVSTAVVVVAVATSGRLLILVAAIQIGPLIAVVVNRFRAYRLGFRSGIELPLARAHRHPVVRYVWAAAWRSGLGVSAAIGSVQLCNILLAQVLAPAMLAPFLLAQRLVAAVVSYASAPFYNGIPRFVSLLKSGKTPQLLKDASGRFMLTNWIMVLGLSAVWYVGPWILRVVGSDVKFVGAGTWMLLSAWAILDRIGAMHLQLYSITNHILWHIANGVTGLLLVLAAVPLYFTFGLAGVALSMLLATALFYVPYSLRMSYREFALSAGHLDILGSILPAITLFAVLLIGWG